MLKARRTKELPLLHPGEYLRSVLDDAGLSANAVALVLRVPANRLTEILNGRRAIAADTALRLGRYFGTSAQMWAEHGGRGVARLRRIHPAEESPHYCLFLQTRKPKYGQTDSIFHSDH